MQIQSNHREIARALSRIERDQLPFATSKALNETANDFQKAQRTGMAERFSIRRRTWANQSVKRGKGDFASKTNLSAIVRLETPGDPSRSDILAKFESGGEKKPADGRSLAVKARKAEKRRPKEFEFVRVGSGPRGEMYRGPDRTFMVKRADGTGGIYQRIGKETKGGKTAGRRRMRDGRDLNVRVLYRFTPKATIDKRLEFHETAQGVFKAKFIGNLNTALAKAVSTAR